VQNVTYIAITTKAAKFRGRSILSHARRWPSSTRRRLRDRRRWVRRWRNTRIPRDGDWRGRLLNSAMRNSRRLFESKVDARLLLRVQGAAIGNITVGRPVCGHRDRILATVVGGISIDRAAMRNRRRDRDCGNSRHDVRLVAVHRRCWWWLVGMLWRTGHDYRRRSGLFWSTCCRSIRRSGGGSGVWRRGVGLVSRRSHM